MVKEFKKIKTDVFSILNQDGEVMKERTEWGTIKQKFIKFEYDLFPHVYKSPAHVLKYDYLNMMFMHSFQIVEVMNDFTAMVFNKGNKKDGLIFKLRLSYSTNITILPCQYNLPE